MDPAVELTSTPPETSPETIRTLTGFEAIAATEERLCGAPVSDHPAIAEGLALAGLRAASLLNHDGIPHRPQEGRLAASCVHHVAGDEPAPIAPGDWGAVLAAGTAQQAVDHTVAAHALSARLGRPVLAVVGLEAAERLQMVRLPGAPGADDTETTEGPETALDVARDVLRRVGERAGRSLEPVTVRGPDDARAAIVVVGRGAEAARAVAEAYTRAGTPTRAVAVQLLAPFPADEVRAALEGVDTIVLADGTPLGDLLTEPLERLAASAKARPRVATVSWLGDTGDLADAVRSSLPDGAPEVAVEATLEDRLGRIRVAPRGPWGEAVARDLLAAVAFAGEATIESVSGRDVRWHGAFGAGRDLVLVTDEDALLDPGLLEGLRPGARLVVLAQAVSGRDLARRLGPTICKRLLEADLDVRWLDLDLVHEAAAKDGGAGSRAAVAGACVSVLDADAVATIAERGLDAGEEARVRWFRAGAEAPKALSHEQLRAGTGPEEQDFRQRKDLPRLPVEPGAKADAWRERVHTLHMDTEAVGIAPGTPVRPAAVAALSACLDRASTGPFVLVPTGREEAPLALHTLPDALQKALAQLKPADRVVADNLPLLERIAVRKLALSAPGANLRELMADAGRALGAELCLGEEDGANLASGLVALVGALPEDAQVWDAREGAAVALHRQVLETVRGPAREAFLDELRALRERLHDLLLLGRMGSAEGKSAKTLRSSMGQLGDRMDLDALSRTIPQQRGSEPLAEDRRARIEAAVVTFDRFLAGDDAPPDVVYVAEPGQMPDTDDPVLPHRTPLTAAIGVFDGLARRMAAVFRAMRVARLEIAGRYRPEVHDAALAALHWEGFTPAELAHTPAVLVVTTGDALRRRHQGELTALLRSSRPVGLLVEDRVAAPDEAADLSRYHAGLGYLAVAHREALVLQTGWGHQEALVDGLARMAHARRPAVALFVTPTSDPPGWASLEAAAALAGRAAPELLYDPDAGPSWADRLTLGANPAPQDAWPTYTLEVEGPSGEETLELPLTWADVVALEPTYAAHLRMIPAEAWSDEQVPLAEYLERFDPANPEPLVPTLLVLDGRGGIQRAVVSRALALATRDRLRAWRVLQELAGHANEFARRAAHAAREDERREAEAKLVEARAGFEAELERVRSDTARESIDRLASALLDMDVASAASLLSGGAPAAPAAAPAQPAPAKAEAPAEGAAEPVEAEAPAEEEDDDDLSLDEAFIDTVLCTTCNECTNLNGQLFVYNADKQAEIGDLSAGTFAELVKAAEACPAACIHPGAPREGDSTATPELIERAKAFN